MRKRLFSAVIGIGLPFGLFDHENMTAHAKAYYMKESFANALKKGTLPDAKGAVGVTYHTLAKKNYIYWTYSENKYRYYIHERKKEDHDMYVFNVKNFSQTSKVQLIGRKYDYVISQKSAQKYFGNAVKRHPSEKMYRTGNYYTIISHDYNSKGTYIYVGTKRAVLAHW